MADVGVRELREHLSQYLARAERGELIRVTDRGRPKAVLGPLPARTRVDQGLAEGWISPGSGAPLGEARRWSAKRPVRDALVEDRDA